MREDRSRGWLRTGVAAALSGLVLGTMVGPPVAASPDDELVWEQGTVTSVADGDTLVANLDGGSGARGSNRIRTIGVQAPEVAHNGTPAECGAAQATDRLKAQLPVGSRLQTRSVNVASNDDYSGGRIVRSLYAQDEEENWYDTSRGTVSEGWLMWFPLAADSSNKPEWAHNLEYRVLADDAAGQARGLWTANLCGAAPYAGANLRVWAKYWGTEEVYVQNLGASDVDLSGWTIRDSAISGYQRLPDPDGPGTSTYVPAGQTVKVFSGVGDADLNLNNLPADNAAFEGDAVYLMDNAGPYATGNLRGWFPYPCNPDSCNDVLSGAITMSTPVAGSGAIHAPSNPGSVAATASADGSGTATVTWAAPTDAGGPGLTYTVTATSADGGAAPAPAAGVTATTHTFTGLTLGRSYTFTVQAVSDGGASAGVSSATAVAPVGPPGAPGTPVAEGRNAAAAVSWAAPAVSGGVDVVRYTASAVGDPSKSCQTNDGATSCVVSGLLDGSSYSFTVTATTSVGSSAATAASNTVVPAAPVAPTVAPDAPVGVVATPGNTTAVVSWALPTNAATAPITAYQVTAYNGRTCTTNDAATSCVVTGLTNGTGYTFTVRATNAVGSADSAPSIPVTPFAYGAARSSAATAPPPPVGSPWTPGYVDLRNDTGTVARLGGYGLWDAKSSRYVSGAKIENRAAYLFDPNLALNPGQTLRVYLGGVAGASTVPGVDLTAYASGVSVGEAGSFIELANLNGAQVACKSIEGGSCARAKVLSAPSSPVGITARSTAADVTVTWGEPISRGGLAISGYTATAYDAPVGGNPIASCTAGGDGRSCAFAASMGRKYYVDVVATNTAGTSGPSWRVLASPKTVPGAPANVAVSGTPGGLNVTWTPAVENGAAITRYTASAYTAATGGKPAGSCTTSNGSMTACTIMKLQGGTQYFVDVVATNRAGTGAPSSPRTPGTPGPGGAVSTYSKGKVTVRWDPASPGSGITGYNAKLYTKKSGGKKVGECSAPAAATSCTTKKMKKRSKYYIDLTVLSAAGASTIKPRIVTGPAKRASAPKVTGATPSARQVTISWAAPSFNGYSYLKGYGARLYSKKKGGSVKAACSAGPTTTACVTKTMKKGTYYSAAHVKNSKGWSKWSKRVKVVVR